MEKVKVFIGYSGNNYGAGCEKYACIATGKDLNEVKNNIADALDFHFEGMRKDGEECPIQGGYVLDFELTTQALLNHYKSIVSFKALSQATGINERLIGHYATGFRNPRPAQREKIIKGYHTIGKDLVSVL